MARSHSDELGKAPSLLISIVTWNNVRTIDNCLRSLVTAAQRANLSDFKIMIFDNNSTDGTAALVSSFDFVELVRSNDNIGFGSAHNQNFRLAGSGKYDYVAIVNPDTVSHSECLRLMMESRSQFDVLVPKLINSDGSVQLSAFKFRATPCRLFWDGLVWSTGMAKALRMIHVELSTVIYCDGRHRIKDAIGAFILLPAGVYEALGGFDENLFLYAEDTDLFYRCTQSGVSVGYIGDAKTVHYGGISTRQNPEAKKLGRVAVNYYIRKHFGWGWEILFRGLFAPPLMFVEWLKTLIFARRPM